jgi:iron-regulated transporter 1
MRAIDMLALMLAPMAAGFLMTFAGMLPAVCVIWVYSALAWLPEITLLRVSHRLAPQLRCGFGR